MSLIEDFLTTVEENEIVDAIKSAENKTSGEIRIHIEKSLDKDPHERVLEVFHYLNMDKTNLNNGVLFYISVEDKSFTIYGDKGIHKKVSDIYWDEIKDLVIDHFKKGEFKNGLVKGVVGVGEKLKKLYPIIKDDTDELSNLISKGK